MSNYAGTTLLIEVVSQGAASAESAPQYNPVRMVYVPGAGGTRVLAATATQALTDGTVLMDSSGGGRSLHLLSCAAARDGLLFVRKTTGDSNGVTIQAASGDVFPDGSTSMTLPHGGDGVLLKFLAAGNVVVPIARVGTAGGGSAGIVTEQTLTANATVSSPGTPGDGDRWTAFLKQDATGGRAVTWGANVLGGPAITATVNSDPSTMCVVQFVGKGGKWYVCSLPVLGEPIA